MDGPEQPVAIAGAGRMAQALGRLLREAGVPVSAVASRDPEHARAAARFIPGAAAVLAEAGWRGGAALHTSGARGLEALAPLAARGVSCGALHPLQTVATPERGLPALRGACYGVTAEGPAAAWAAAVMASNYLVGLAGAAVMLMEAAGIEPAAAREALAPLMRAGVENAVRLGPARALTGPVERGDVRTVAAHWHALAAVPETVRELYRAAGLYLLDLAGRPADPRHAALEKWLRHV